MVFQRSTASIALAAALLFAGQAAFAADAYNPESTRINNGEIVFGVGEEGTVTNFSSLTAQTQIKGQNAQWACNGTHDLSCDFTDKSFGFGGTALLAKCETENQSNCIESLELAAPGKDFTSASFIRYAGGFHFDADPKYGLPEGRTPSLWSAPDAPSASGTTGYAVVAKESVGFSPANQSKFDVGSLSASVIPYRLQAAPGTEAPYQQSLISPSGQHFVGEGGNATNCAWNEKDNCGVRQDFLDGTKVRLKVRVASTVGGWFKGRMTAPDISVNKLNSATNEISISGSAAGVPRFTYVKKFADLTSQEMNFYRTQGHAGTPETTQQSWGSASGLENFAFLEAFRSGVKDAASGENSMWSMSTVNSGYGSDCLSDTSKVLGVVTTTAMVYEGVAPSFSHGQLAYKVGGMHFMPDGTTPVEGKYDLVMRSETARCLYGFSKAPISATISVTGAAGESKVATTVVSEKDGWLHLAAYGFTFSSPTISVKMTQAKATPAKTTITCAKGKLTKKVTAVDATCPSGYKKK